MRLKWITATRGSDRIATGEEMENFRSSKAKFYLVLCHSQKGVMRWYDPFGEGGGESFSK